MTAIATITHDERALLLRMERCRRDVRHGAVQLRAGLLRPERLRRDAAEDTRMVGVRGVRAGDRVLRRGRTTDDGDRRRIRAIRAARRRLRRQRRDGGRCRGTRQRHAATARRSAASPSRPRCIREGAGGDRGGRSWDEERSSEKARSVNRAFILSRLTRYGGSEWRRLK